MLESLKRQLVKLKIKALLLKSSDKIILINIGLTKQEIDEIVNTNTGMTIKIIDFGA